MSTQQSARDLLLDVISFTECANNGRTPEGLLDAHARVAALPTANQGQLICATREQILDAIITAGGAR